MSTHGRCGVRLPLPNLPGMTERTSAAPTTTSAPPPWSLRVTRAALVAATWAAMISFGGVLAETVMLYPNIFRDPPGSLVLARDFLVAGSPSDFFPPLGMATILGCAAATASTWRDPRVRWWILSATVVYVCCEFLFSAVFFWPRNTIMFVDPVGTHAPAYLREVAAEFVAGHWVRVVGGGATAVLLFTALLRWHRPAAEAAATRRP
jgi:hypothetical protein